MMNEAIDLVATWLADGTHGVNALLPSVPRKAGDAEPPPIASILASTRSGMAARGNIPSKAALYPALVVAQDGRAELDLANWPTTWDCPSFPIGILYLAREVESDVGVRDANYTIRAILRSLYRLIGPDVAAAVTARNNVYGNSSIAVSYMGGVELIDTVSEIDDGVILGGVKVKLRVRDNSPGGA